MGNTEIKQIVQETALNNDEVGRLQQLYHTYGNALQVERSMFASVFDANSVSYHIIDRLFLAFDVDTNGCIDISELALGLVCCDRCPVEDKLRFLFTVLSSNGDKKLPHRELKRALGAAICKTLHRIRGKGGQWLDRECAGCKRTPSGVVYACFDCCAGYIMGVPITVHLCGDCCKSWEGVLEEKGTDTQHHARHTLTCHGAVPAGGQVYHTGVQCDSCGMLPIVGPRYHCKDCKDMLALCGSCHDEGAEPLAHAASHNCIVITEQQTLEEQVQFFLDELFDDMDAHSEEAPIPMQQFLEWGLQSELVNNILHGFEMQYVRLCPAEESVELREETYHQDPNIGRIELDELQGK